MPIVAALVPAAIGAYQAISGAVKANKARKAAENLQPPQYAPSKQISDYYQSALNRYNAGPYNSAQYLNSVKGANTALSTGVNALQDRRSAIGNIGALTTGYNNNLQNAGVKAEQSQSQKFGQLGQAANAQLGDSRFAWQQNANAPYEKNLQLDYAQLGGANSLISAGLSNIGTSAQTIGLNAMRKNPQYQNMGYYGGYS